MVKSTVASVESAMAFLDQISVKPGAARMRAMAAVPSGGLSGVSSAVSAVSSSISGISSSISSGLGSSNSTSKATSQSSSSSSSLSSATTIDGAASILNDVAQSFAVGSGIISFDSGVTADRRVAAINSVLLAQLHANSLYPSAGAASYSADWFASFSDTLEQLGWVAQDNKVGTNSQDGNAANISTRLFSIIGSFIGVDGMAAIKAALSTLEAAVSGGESFAIFSQQVQATTVSDFSASLGSGAATDDFVLKCSNLNLTATDQSTTILFFSWDSAKTNINWNNLELSLDESVFNQIKDTVAQKISPNADSIKNLAT